ncbi:hypothetical protein [Arthrobacter sp. FW306-2-2C-D06B]|uniref:hypothetical protein n=1 Tax=Arthrobacter sp. FW306-2-2C-D06B TaxID=2879618 RepID=UPI001F1BC47C|nr:hypothetical protein [Arthrobacter sp. FW306-2-2C-D06B]UKA60674.1 hypothetical protein LFT47_10245 [Arthrobacter sp. FW306-2-2C-D06B]
MKKSIAALALAGTIALAGTAPAVASTTYPAPGNEYGTVSDGTIARGESITFSGSGYIAGETVNITFQRTGGKKAPDGGRPAPSNFSVIADGTGAFSTSITFMDGGNYMIGAVGATSGNKRWAAVVVNSGNGGGKNDGGGNHGGGNGKANKGNSGLAAVSSVTAAGTASGDASTNAESNLVLWSLVGAGALAASAASTAVIRRRAKR